MKVAYICDGLASCSDKIGCYRCAKPGMDQCKHTFDPKHAKNGAVEHPEAWPDRFRPIDLDDDEVVFWEGDVFIPWP